MSNPGQAGKLDTKKPPPETAPVKTTKKAKPILSPKEAKAKAKMVHAFGDYDDEEREELSFKPHYTFQTYVARQYRRIRILLHQDSACAYTANDYKIYVDQECGGNEFVFQRPYSQALLDPHKVNTFINQTYGRVFGEDSTLIEQMEEDHRQMKHKSARPDVKGVWASFRLPLPFPCQEHVSDDLGSDGLILTKIDESNILIVELKGKERLPEPEERTKQVNKDLVSQSFTSPARVVDKAAREELVHACAAMLDKGLVWTDVVHVLATGVVDNYEDTMDIDELEAEATKKRKKPATA